jgi:hypothetical protein
VLGTAILIAIVGEPTTLTAALQASDDAYLFGVGAAVTAGLVSLAIVPARAPATLAPALEGAV